MKALISFYKIIEILIQLYGHPSNLPYGHPFNLPVPSTTYTKTNKCKQTVSAETSYLPPYTHTWPKFVSLKRILILFTDCFQSYIRDTLGSISHLQSVIFNQSSSISHLQSVIFNQSSSISDLQSVIFNQPSSISDLQSVIFHQWSSISHLQSVIFNQWSSISDLQSVIFNQSSSISDLQSVIFNQSSSISDFSSSCSYHSHPTQIASSTHPIDLETIPEHMEIWSSWLKIFERWILWFRTVTIHKF